MSLTIPLRVQPLATTAAGTRLNLPRLRLLGRGTQPGDDDVLRAVGAAVALRDPKAALQAVHDLRAEDADLAARFDEITSSLDPVLASVVEVQRDRTRAGTPSDEERAFADAVAADPALVSAAAGALKGADAATIRAAALWVGISDIKLLETAAGVGARRNRLGPILTGPTPTGLADLEKKVDQGFKDLNDKIDKNVKDLNAKIDAITPSRSR